MIGKMAIQLFRKVNYSRHLFTKDLEERYGFIKRNIVGCNTYVLKEKYSYDEVRLLNNIAGESYSAAFGFCEEIGPVAFIGIAEENRCKRSGFFRYKVRAYGTPLDMSECYFELYTKREAEEIDDYTVYGQFGCEYLALCAPIAQLDMSIDKRMAAKISETPRVFCMDCKLNGKYNYVDAVLLAQGSLDKVSGYNEELHPIVFAEIEGGHHIGIIGMRELDIDAVRGFRDVWEYGAKEPVTQYIRFLKKEEAMNIDDYELYVHCYSCSGIGKEKYSIEKYDRTLDPRFDFRLSDGNDYRLVEHKEWWLFI